MAVPTSAVSFSSSQFEFVHGHKPRGQGWWVFEGEGHHDQFGFSGSFAEAKKAARQHFAARGTRQVRVCE